MNISSTSGFGFGASANLQQSNRALQKILEKLSTSRRINRASDDAAGLAISQQLSSQVRGFKMAQNNVSDALSSLRIADGANSQINAILQRQRDLALQASNGTLSDEQRGAIDTEFQQLQGEIDRIAGATQFNRQNLTDGTDLASGNAQIVGDPNAAAPITLPALDVSTSALGTSGISVADQSSASGALDAIDTALDNLGARRGEIGAMMNRFESVGNNLSVSMINSQAAESTIGDLDTARGIAELTRQQLLGETGIRAFARFNQISQNHIFALLQ